MQPIGESKTRSKISIVRLPQRCAEWCKTDRGRVVDILPCGEKRVSTGGRRGAQFPSQPVGQRKSLRDIPNILRVQRQGRRLDLSRTCGGRKQIGLSRRQKVLYRIRGVAERTASGMLVEKDYPAIDAEFEFMDADGPGKIVDNVDLLGLVVTDRARREEIRIEGLKVQFVRRKRQIPEIETRIGKRRSTHGVQRGVEV